MTSIAIVDGRAGEQPAEWSAAGLPIFAASDALRIERWLAEANAPVLISAGSSATASVAASLAMLHGAALVHCGARTDPWSIEAGFVAPDEAIRVARTGVVRELHLVRVDSTVVDAPIFGLVVALGGAASIAAELLGANSLAGVAGAIGRRLLAGRRDGAEPLDDVVVDGEDVVCDALLATSISRVVTRLEPSREPRLAWGAHRPQEAGRSGSFAWAREGLRACARIEVAGAPAFSVDGRAFAAAPGARLSITVGAPLRVLTR